ncbi:MAG TPA: GNAT family N-acetyltransferase [Acidimicrobiales bacterium]|nr:GNAT family N-acetyltransferase [Acidimicrobiales bacterium]
MTGRAVLALPDPPLVDAAAGIVLRPWRTTPGDVAALAAAWDDPDVAATSAPPADRSAAAAERWIAGAPGRLAAGLALDLVITGRDGGVLGEVGLRNLDAGRRRAELGWWVAAPHRGRGLAGVAVGLVAGWALGPPCGLRQVWARIVPGNAASAAVARRAGLVRLGTAAGTEVWARSAAA